MGNIIILYSYRLISSLFIFLVPILLVFRYIKRKEKVSSICERFGITSKTRPDGKLVMIHAASVGEVMSVIKFVEEYIYMGYNVLLTTTTLSGAKIVNEKFSDQSKKENIVIHHFLPLDIVFFIIPFLSYWKPNKIIFVESEIWPNFLTLACKRKYDIYLVNARMSDKAFTKWSKLPRFFEYLMQSFKSIFPQSMYDFEKFKDLNPNTYYIGNLKFDTKIPETKDYLILKLSKSLENKIVIIAVSTHKGEEEIILQAFSKIFSRYDNTRFILAPRHSNRISEIKNILSKFDDLNYVLHTEVLGEWPESKNLYIVNTIGELGNFLYMSNCAIICGSFIDSVGGHNPIEAAYFDNLIITGKYYSKTVPLYQMFIEHKAVKVAENGAELCNIIIDFIEGSYREYAENAKNLVSSIGSISRRIIDEIESS